MRNWNRALLGLAAAGVIALGTAIFILSSGQQASAVGDTFTIEIFAKGFNPQTCVVNRNDSVVQFKNVDSKPHRVIRPDMYDPDPEHPTYLWDSGTIAPGETSSLIVTSPLDWSYQDFDDPSKTGVIIAPVNPGAASECAPLTPTPTPTKTPKATVTPTPTQFPPRCYGSQGCAVAAGVSNDEGEP